MKPGSDDETIGALLIDRMRDHAARATGTTGGWRHGALTGSIIIGALGILAGAEVCAYSETGDCNPLLVGVGLAAIGAALGFPIGGMIGEVMRPGKYEWQTIWPTSRN